MTTKPSAGNSAEAVALPPTSRMIWKDQEIVMIDGKKWDAFAAAFSPAKPAQDGAGIRYALMSCARIFTIQGYTEMVELCDRALAAGRAEVGGE